MSSDQDEADFQELIRGVWGEYLGQSDLSPEDDFFERGGHSLLALTSNGKLEHLLQIDIPLRTIFDHPVLADFAAAVRNIAQQAKLS